MDAQFPFSGMYEVDVSIGLPKRDIFQNPLGADLFDCTHSSLPSRRMVKRNPHGHAYPPPKFDVLCTLEHPTLLAVRDFFLDKDGKGCLVVESADEAFKTWMERTKQAELFIETEPGKVRLSPMLRAMIIELADLMEALKEENSYVSELSIENLFIKNKTEEGRPTLKVLLDYNVVSVSKAGYASGVVRSIIDSCCKFHHVTLDASSSSFKSYIGDHKSLPHLERYPDTWNDEQKQHYILKVFSGDKTTTKLALSKTKVVFPGDPKSRWVGGRREKALPVLEDIRSHHKKLKRPVTYEDNDWGYMLLCRNVLKEFNIPPNRKADIADRVAFLRMMELWYRNIWFDLYTQFGPVEDGELKS